MHNKSKINIVSKTKNKKSPCTVKLSHVDTQRFHQKNYATTLTRGQAFSDVLFFNHNSRY